MAGAVQQAQGTTEERHRLPVKTLVSASIGNAVEWFDWTVYATFVVYFAGQFFPAENRALALIGATSTYALAFFFRPLGGILLGRFADLRGRKAGMLLTILLMAGGSMVIAILPTYEQVGWLAPILLLLARIAQGMSLGGEVSSASAYLGEIAPPAHRGRYSAFFYISTGSALLAASLLGVLLTSTLSEDQLQSYGWRIAFFIGGVLGLLGMWLRRSLVETEQFEENAAKARATKHPLWQTVRHHPKAVLQLIAITLLNTLSYYTFFSALTPFAINFRDADGTDVFLALSIGTTLFVALCYPFGALSDRFGRKPQLLVWSGAYALLIVPLSFLVQDNLFSLIVVFCTGLGLYALMASIAPAIMSELFPTELRATGIGAWYNLTVATFGGTAPLVIVWLSNNDRPLWFFWYVAVAAVISFLVILTTLRETKGTDLR
ncbi:MFS transporter [Geodermatophilus sp. DSM 45219]|uniref:MFS transporter n=1 Tax=Geodermatophilus sp. DSM 45219 TaxID=1881103 RepID=UPI000891C5E2|nr:MFS transporter [Geodermatophilus sp. DSM 45219]SDN48656.1 MFS transporter, MHS family, alpha-ketoglutarate permease [Geodermatophilus sp. DSM 45219]